MTMKRNPKQEGTSLWDCIPQTGDCPMNCNQCFYNRPGAFYHDKSKPLIPKPSTVGDGIVRVNCGHDSNVQRELVIRTAQKYKHYFFNTSILPTEFPGPVVLTANRSEEQPAMRPFGLQVHNIMFVRLRVSVSNITLLSAAIYEWNKCRVPVVLTFMNYYESEAMQKTIDKRDWRIPEPSFEARKHILNTYWCMTKKTKRHIMLELGVGRNSMLTTCGTINSPYCRDCRNCESFYWQTRKRLIDMGVIR